MGNFFIMTIASLSDYKKRSNNENDQDKELDTNSYAGGEKSGIAIQNPTDNKDLPNIDDLNIIEIYDNGFLLILKDAPQEEHWVEVNDPLEISQVVQGMSENLEIPKIFRPFIKGNPFDVKVKFKHEKYVKPFLSFSGDARQLFEGNVDYVINDNFKIDLNQTNDELVKLKFRLPKNEIFTFDVPKSLKLKQ